MNKNEATLGLDDFDQHNRWEVEWESPEEIKRIPLLAQIDASLCDVAHIGKIRDRWFLLWTERHPELGTVDELFKLRNRDAIWDRKNRKGDAVLREYHELEKRMPPRTHVKEIARREAFVAIARCWLPPEFHKDLGIAS